MPASVFGQGTSTHDPRLRLISNTVPPDALPMTGLATLGDLCTSADAAFTVSSVIGVPALCPNMGVVLKISTIATAET